jgi:hypothetical protein
MTADENPELEYLRIESHRTAAQVQSLRSALVVSSNCLADLMLLTDSQDPDVRAQARTRIAEALTSINQLLAGQSFDRGR